MERITRHAVPTAARLALALLLVLAAFAGLGVPRAAATNTLVVTNTNDSGPGSLPQAISDALPNDTITFAPSVSGGTITLPNNPFGASTYFIVKPLTIRGPGANLLTISGNDGQQIFFIGVGDQERVEISGLTLTHGYAKQCFNSCETNGGALKIAGGIITLANLNITNNRAEGSAGGILIQPAVFGDPPNITERYAEVTLRDSIVSGNVAQDSGGGMVIAGGRNTIERSTISGNSATLAGGVSVSSYYTPTATTFRNTTISGNRAKTSGGGIGMSASGIEGRFSAAIESSTITGNVADADNNGSGYGGGISLFSGGGATQINVRDSLIIGNQAPFNQGADCSGGPPVASQGHNIWGTVFSCPTNGPGDMTLAVLGVGVGAVLNPTLALNAPGATPTHALVQGSPAISAAATGAACPATDQRGVTRPQGAGCDIGAYEFGPEYAVTRTTSGPGTTSISPAGLYSGDQQVTVLATWNDQAAIFAGWTVDGTLVGWLNPLVLPIQGRNHTVHALFVPRTSFPDVPAGRDDLIAITELASRGLILGYGNGKYGPDDTVQRAQMAALVARAMQAGPGTPPTTLAPPACIVANSWDCEDWGNNFQDRGDLDASLWRNIGTLQHYGVAFGYDGAGCATRGVAAPCFAPNEAVTHAQTISFITRAMEAKGLWVDQPGELLPYAEVPGPHLADFKTFYHYTTGNGGIPAPPANWNADATRGWFARALWAALNSYYATNHLP